MTFKAAVIADSISNGIRLTSLELCYPRFIHADFMTHRVFSRNASSSRAMPVKKVLEQVREHPALPIHWGKNQAGMQATEELDSGMGKVNWDWASFYARKYAGNLADLGYHKQIVNRLLEPYQWMTTIVTATEWENFFKLRDHEAAQPELQHLAKLMKEAMRNSVAKVLDAGQWHLPYVIPTGNEYVDICCSVARCARVSYLNHDKSHPDVGKDMLLAASLLEDGHMSPFEHQATPMKHSHYTECEQRWEKGVTHTDVMSRQWSGNFRGWIQHRQMIGETI